MRDVNKMIILGRLGSDPIQRQTKTGLSVVHLSVATSRRTLAEGSQSATEGPQYLEETQWHKVVVWGKQGEACAQYLKKGNLVYIEGSIRSRNYEDKEGQRKVSFDIHAETVSFLGVQRQSSAENFETPVLEVHP